MIKIGMMIGDRYEVLEKIGTGGMSDVYKAKCHKLNRFVSIKVLKQEFSENANFVSKFRTEAQAAAGLMHPNIVNVYDVGEENGIHYIVMELVEGITLKKYIEKKARLSFKEAVSIAIQVSMGIQAAHNNHIIHRDIKPQNIMISKDGKVKVTDFGIAKAATSNTITSNVMGSVHYTSPEQARGGYSDEKSDIYSLGITMFEMLTGRVPFNGETTVAIAIKHIQEELPSPKEFVPEIPGSVESIVIKCCQKSPDRRYQNMQDLVADLKQSLMSPDADFVVKNDPDMEGGTRMITDSDMRKIKRRTNGREDYRGEGYGEGSYQEEAYGEEAGYPEEAYQEGSYPEDGYPEESYAQAGYGEAFPEESYPEEGYPEEAYPEEIYPEQESYPEQELYQEQEVYPEQEPYQEQEPYPEESYPEEPYPEESYPEEPYPQQEQGYLPRDPFEENEGGEEEGEEYDYNPDMDKLATVLTLVMGLVICVIVAVLAVKLLGSWEEGEENSDGPILTSEAGVPGSGGEQSVTMPRVMGKAVEEARNELAQLGLKSEVEYQDSDTVPAGEGMNSSVGTGEEVLTGSTVILTASAGPQGIEVPSVTDMDYEDADIRLTSLGFVVTKVEGNSDEVAQGVVMSQFPSAGTHAPRGTNITVTVSQGREKIWVPMLVGHTEEDGTALAIEAGLEIREVTYEYNAEYEEGTIFYQSCSYNHYVEPGTLLDIKVSQGQAASYKYTENIMPPTQEEAPDYVQGSEVAVQLVTDSGQVLMDSRITGFPHVANYYGITSAGGTMTMTYTVTIGGGTTTDPETGETVSVPGTTESRSFTRRIEFTQE